MLNIFPGLLYPFLAPTLLRIGVGLAFLVVAYWLWKRQDEASETDLPVIGRNGWWVWFSLSVHVLVAVALMAGYYTQIAALIGALLGLKHAFWAPRYPALFPLGRAGGLLVLLICLSLVLSGAGALAQDLPL